MNKENVKIRRALISVYDKNGIIPIARELENIGCEIISTGGTAKILSENSIKITDISKVTGNPEAFDGRMKTISFQIESALLFDRENDREEAEKLGIIPIDMVVCNLYPFEKVLNEDAELDILIENIDIGGPTMIRAGAKNFKYVTVITNPDDYPAIIEELKNNNGEITYNTRMELMAKAFNHTADYDSLIAQTMDKQNNKKSLRLSFVDGKELRYGENSHQKAYMFKEKSNNKSLYDMKVLHGKELSYNNIIDINAAIEAVKKLNSNACSIIKHTNPCGLCEGTEQRKVFEFAWDGDPVSAFGSIIAFNKTVELNTIEFLDLQNKDKSKRKFVEVIIATKFTEDALDYLSFHKNLRVIEYDTSSSNTNNDIKYFNGCALLQDTDDELYSKLELVTKTKPFLKMDEIKPLIDFGIKAITNIKSNSIAIVREKEGYNQLIGMGAGQPNRLISTKLAIEKAKTNLANECDDVNNIEKHINEELSKVILISDAYIPFPDNVELAGKHGIKAIIQPGGSIRDKSVIAECEKHGIAMIFTGIRHFKH